MKKYVVWFFIFFSFNFDEDDETNDLICKREIVESYNFAAYFNPR